MTDNRKKVSRIFTAVFLALEALFFALFVTADSIGREIWFASDIWRFAVIETAFCYVALKLFFTSRYDKIFRRRLFLFLAMTCTLVSDFLLVILASYRELAVFIFFAAQVFHAMEIYRSKKRLIWSLSLRFGTSVVVLSVLAISGIITPLYAAVALYAPQLIGNLIENVFGVFCAENSSERRRSILLSVGFLLFLGCDICLGLAEIGVPVVGGWIWRFYAPSQAIIAVSGEKIYAKNSN